MTRERARRSRPKPWAEQKQNITWRWTVPFYKVEWYLAWASWALGNWAFLEVLEHLGTLSVLIAVIFYFAESGRRTKQRHYEAWQVINTAQGRGGSGGRIEALQELNADNVSLIGVKAEEAFLQGIHLRHARLSRCDLHAADLRNSDLNDAQMSFCKLQSANFRSADLRGADLQDAELQDADLNGARLQGANFGHADLRGVDLREAEGRDINWKAIKSMKLANVFGMKNASKEFLQYAARHGAVSVETTEDWNNLVRNAEASVK